MSDSVRVAAGHKATIANPNTSEEAKQHSKEVLEKDLKKAATSNDPGDVDTDEKDPDNVARGLKAAISNPRVSDEAKESAKEKLDNM